MYYFLNLRLIFKFLNLIQVKQWNGPEGHLDGMNRHVNMIIGMLFESYSLKFVHLIGLNMLLKWFESVLAQVQIDHEAPLFFLLLVIMAI